MSGWTPSPGVPSIPQPDCNKKNDYVMSAYGDDTGSYSVSGICLVGKMDV